jgi:hypothetical protein
MAIIRRRRIRDRKWHTGNYLCDAGSRGPISRSSVRQYANDTRKYHALLFCYVIQYQPPFIC